MKRKQMRQLPAAIRGTIGRGTLRIVMVVSVALAVTAGLGFSVAGQSHGVDAPPARQDIPPSQRVLAVQTMRISPVTSFQAAREHTGSVVARRIGELGFELSGRIDELLVDEGDRVSRGMALARLNTDRLETRRRQTSAKRAQATADLQEMIAGPRQEDIDAAGARVEGLEAQVELLKIQTERRKKLVVGHATSRDEYEQHKFGLKARSAQLREAQHNLQELLNGTRKEKIEVGRAVVEELDAAVANIDVDVAKSTLVAPFDGTVARRLSNEGTVLEMGSPVIRLVEDEALEVWVGLPVDAANRVTAGSAHRVKIGGQTFDAVVTSWVPEVDHATRTRTIILRLEHAASQQVVHGQVARLTLEQSIAASGFWLPATSLTHGARGLWSVYAVAAKAVDNRSFHVQRRDVEIIHAEKDRVLVRGAITAGEHIVTSGTHRIVPGQRVDPSDQQPQESL